MTKDAMIETLKEGARLALFAAVGALVDFAIRELSGLEGIDPIVVAFVTYLLRLIDKFIHENESIKLNGLSPI